MHKRAKVQDGQNHSPTKSSSSWRPTHWKWNHSNLQLGLSHAIGLTSIICFLAEAVELLLCCKVKKHKINICSITVTILRRQSGPRFCSIVLAIMIFQRFKIYDVPFLALDLAAFSAPACLYFAKQDKWSTHIWTLSLIHIWRCRRIERCRSRWSPYH